MLTPFKSFLHLSYLWARTHAVERSRRWQSASHGSPRVFYGHDHIPGRKENTSGGIIKCQDLSEHFPNTRRGANVLYLVSSVLPPFASVMVRYARCKGVKFVLNQNGVAFPAYHGNQCARINGPRRQLLKQADYVIYQSRYSQESADRFLYRYEGTSIVLHNPVNTSTFVPSSRQKDLKRPILLIAGSHRHAYRVESALRALAQLRERGIDASLRIAGRLAWRPSVIQCKEELLSLSHMLGVRSAVHVLDAYGQCDAVTLFQGADLLIHTQYMDCCPRLVVEAMACGLPIVYSSSGGVPELVGGEAGIGVPAPVDWAQIHPPDPWQMASAISRIMESYPEFSKAARARSVQKFDVRPWIQRHREIFEKVILET